MVKLIGSDIDVNVESDIDVGLCGVGRCGACATGYAGLVPQSDPFSDSSVSTRLLNLSVGVCLFGGLLTSLVSLLVPRLKLLLGLSSAEALLVQLAFYSSYLLFAFPAARLMVRAGYMRAIATGSPR